MFRPLTHEDIPSILEMMQDFYAIDNYPFDADTALLLLKEFIGSPHLGKGWLILYEGETAGYIILTYVFSFEYKGRIAFLDELYINPNFRNLGLGKAAVNHIKEEAVKERLRLVYLELEEHNIVARQVYLKKGFTPHNRQILKLKP